MTHYPTFERIVTAIADQTGYDPKGGPTRKKGVCPAHEDSRPSLTIRWDEDKKVVGITCWSGCTFDEVVRSLGLTKEDFRDRLPGSRSGRKTRSTPEPKEAADEPRKGSRRGREKNAPGRNEVARYPYTDADGKVLYYNVRFDPKDFRMAGPDGSIKELPKNIKRVPYNLPAVIAAVESGETVYWVEGEKDADNVNDAGGVGTCLAGGVNGPLSSDWFAEYFAGADLVVIGDRDKPGEKFAKEVARAAVNHVARVRIGRSATPQPKSDATDHLAAGYRLDQFEWMPMRSVRRTRWSVHEIMTTKPEPLRWVLPGIIPEGLTLLVGAPKAGKSWLNLNLMAALTTGRPIDIFGWGQNMESTPSLYLALEDPMRRIHDRMHQVTKNLDFRAQIAGDIWLTIDPLAQGGREDIERWLEAHPTARAIMVDVLAKVRGGDDGQTMYQADYEAVGALKDIADDYGIGVVVTHHDRKKTDDDFVNMVSGTKGVTGAADTILYLERKRGSDDGTLKSESRDVEGCTYKMQFVREYGRWQIMERVDPDADGGAPNSEPKMPLVDQISQIVLMRGESSMKDIAKMLDTPEATVKRAAADALQNGQLARTSNGLWYVPKAV